MIISLVKEKRWKLLGLGVFLGSLLACEQAVPELVDKRSESSGTDLICDTLATTSSSLPLLDAKVQFFNAAKRRLTDLYPKPIEIIADLSSYAQSPGVRHGSFDFAIDHVPLCQFYARVHSLPDRTLVRGHLPQRLDLSDVPFLEWDENDADEALILYALGLKGLASDIKRERCIAWDGERLSPGWNLSFRVDELPFSGLVSQGKVLNAESHFLHATTTASSTIYKKQSEDSTELVLTTMNISDVSGGGSLCSARFKTQVPSNFSPAFSRNHVFSYSPTDPRFNETSIFTNASNHADWFMTLGILSEWPGPRITLSLVDSRSNNYVNNKAVYLPQKSSSTYPTIELGNGDGVDLQNLHIDPDVVSHELGHHIVYRTLKSTSGESLVLHEGITDFFVFVRTNNTCLGELICPASSNLCASTACLRSANNTLKFGSPDLPTEAHKQSQVISGMLWDIGKTIGESAMAKIMLKAIDFFDRSAGYANFITSLMNADKALNKGVNTCTIESAAEDRGLEDVLESNSISCQDYQ
ncbi:MAG: hypothetical protein HYW48_03975 [Deltaproteobacteria bacterium]|nr:hypothetical protein [Deltaproteobacteria bacterium]